MIKEKLEAIRSGKLKAADNINTFLKVIKAKNKDINAFLHVDDKGALEAAEKIDARIKKGEKAGKLAGLAIAIKSCINVTGMPVSCASKTLENYYGTYDAEAVKKIRKEDGIIIGMTNMDEFACGSSGESSAFGSTKNPSALDRIPGGSSSGSSAAVAAEMCDIALGTDTGGSIRNPASHCGIFGVKPSYGRVSRYGLVDLSMSLDQIGPLCSDAYGCALMLEVIAGKSRYDSITYDKKVPNYAKELPAAKPKKLRIGMCREFEKLCTDKRIYDLISEKAKKFAKDTGSQIFEIDLPNVELAIQTYYPLVYVELFSGTRKLDGRRYGHVIEETCKDEVLRRILGGKEISKAEYEGKYYRKALQVKNLIKKSIEKAFEKVDIIILPTTPMLPHKLGTKIEDPLVEYAYDAFTIPANLAGICAGVVPAGKIDNVPVGLQIYACAFNEQTLLDVMNSI